MISSPSKKILDVILWEAVESEITRLGAIPPAFVCDLPEQSLDREEMVAAVKYCVEQDLLVGYLATYFYYADAVAIEKSLCFSYIENPKYWEWTPPSHPFFYLEATLKGRDRLMIAEPLGTKQVT